MDNVLVLKSIPDTKTEEGLLGPYDISDELARTYEYVHFTGGEMHNLYRTIQNPVKLWIKPKAGRTGSHRILDAQGVVHYAQEDWKWLSWIPKDVTSPVAF